MYAAFPKSTRVQIKAWIRVVMSSNCVAVKESCEWNVVDADGRSKMVGARTEP